MSHDPALLLKNVPGAVVQGERILDRVFPHIDIAQDTCRRGGHRPPVHVIGTLHSLQEVGKNVARLVPFALPHFDGRKRMLAAEEREFYSHSRLRKQVAGKLPCLRIISRQQGDIGESEPARLPSWSDTGGPQEMRRSQLPVILYKRYSRWRRELSARQPVGVRSAPSSPNLRRK